MKNNSHERSSAGQLRHDWKNFKSGKTRLRTWSIDAVTGQRTMVYKNINEIRDASAQAIKGIRLKKLKMSQSRLAKSIHVNIRTLQGWEIGKSRAPEPVLLLLKLMMDFPEVRRKLARVV